MSYKFIFASKFLSGFVGCMMLLAFSNSSTYAQTTDEIIVKGKVLYSDQVNALKTPVPILNVPQSLSVVT
ncbi:MAG: hypothetical protein VXX14_01210, partial [Pseudomonadota bacterium]|nr:hypothetical protein [Pseudomonadota bacterium]